MHRRKPFIYETKKEFGSRKSNISGGKLSEIIDFHMNGKNRYMKINQTSKLKSNGTRSLSRFKNPLLNRFEFDGEEEYEPKQFYFDFVEDKRPVLTKPARSRSNERVKHVFDHRISRQSQSRDRINEVKRKESRESKDRLIKSDRSLKTVSSSKLKQRVSLNLGRGSRLKQSLSALNTTQKEREKSTDNRKMRNKSIESRKESDKSIDNRKERDKTVDNRKYSDESIEKDRIIDNQKIDHVIEMIEKTLGESPVINHTESPRKEKNVTEEEKLEYFKEKNIQMNKSIDDNKNAVNLTQKPVKTHLASEALAAENKRQLKSASTQTKKDLSLDLVTDRLQYTQTANSYVNTLIDDVQKIFDKDEKERKNAQAQLNGSKRNSINQSPEETIKQNQLKNTKDDYKYTNSLGLALEGKHGINMAIIKGLAPEHLQDPDKQDETDEQILLKKNYQNLEELISQTMLSDENDSHYLIIAKLNRLKVLMELSMRMVGRSYQDIGHEERSTLELEANRFHTTFPLPGEEVLMEEVNEKGLKQVRMPIKIVQSDGTAKIDINKFYQIEPSEFLTMYTKKLLNHAHETTGLKFENVTVAIPAAYGTQQREAIKKSLNRASERDDIQILTRSVAASVILNNKRNTRELNRLKTDLSSSSQNPSETYKLVFDMTEISMDAAVIRIKESKDFHAISNVGDTSFGVHDVDERILAYIINEKSVRSQINKKRRISLLDRGSAYDLETVNAYANLIKNIKKNIVDNGAVTVDLSYIDETKNSNELDHRIKPQDELFIDKIIINNKLCKDIYDWALAHIEKAITQADVNDRDVDEIIIIGEQHKMPGFYEYLRHAYPYKRISYVKEEDLAVGASIVGRKLKYQQIKITEVLCRSIGIGLYTGVITYLLFRNASLPVIGGCVYSTLVDDQESMVLDIYEGERPHIKFSRYLGEVIIDLPKGRAGTVKCEVYLKMNHEGLLQVKALDLTSGLTLQTSIDANPDNINTDVNNDTELDPIEAERYKKLDYDLVYDLEKLDEHLEELNHKYRSHSYSKIILEKIFDTKEWVFKNRRTISLEECHGIQTAINKFLSNINKIS